MPKERPVGSVLVDLDPRDETGVRDTYALGAHPGGQWAVKVAVQETPREGKQSEKRGPGLSRQVEGPRASFLKQATLSRFQSCS